MLDDFVGHVLLVVLNCRVIKSATNESFGCKDGVFGVGDGLPLGGSADKFLTLLGESNHGRSGSVTLSVFNDLGGAAFHEGHTGVGGTQVDTDDGAFAGGAERLHELLVNQPKHDRNVLLIELNLTSTFISHWAFILPILFLA